MSSIRNPFGPRPFHHRLPAVPAGPWPRDSAAPVDPDALRRVLEDRLQDLRAGPRGLTREDALFLKAWLRAFFTAYAPHVRGLDVRPASDGFVLTLGDRGAEHELLVRPGAARNGSLAEYDYLEIPPCDMVAILCPVWTTLYAPLTLASIVSTMAAAGHAVEPLDLNVWMHRALERMGRDDLLIMWHSQVNFTLWADEAQWADEMMRLFDEVVDRVVASIVRSGARTVGMTLYSSNVELSIRLAHRIKAADPTITVVFGGSSSTAAVRFVARNGYHGRPTAALAPHDPWRVAPEWFHRLLHCPDVDYLVAGESEVSLPALHSMVQLGADAAGIPGVATLRDGVFQFAPEELQWDLDTIPYPDWRRLEPRRYGRPDHLPFWFSRGCINRCAYCTNNAYFEHGYRCRSPRNALGEMQEMMERHGVTTFGFTDLCCNGDMAGLEAFLDLKMAAGVDARWHSYVVMRRDMPRRLVDKMVASGNIRFEYGFESGSDAVLRLMGKTYDTEVAARLLRWTTAAGGLACVNLVVGFPHETEENLDETIAFLTENARWVGQVASMNAFYLMPHSRVLERAEALGIDLGWGYGAWRLADGTNDARIRWDRVTRLCRAIDDAGIAHGSPYDLTITDEAPEVSSARRALELGRHPDRGHAGCGPLLVSAREGHLELTYQGAPLTHGLHAYTALRFAEDEPFVDSARGAFAVASDGPRLRAAVTWPDLRVMQIWWVDVLDGRRVRLVVETQVRHPTPLLRRQTHVMLRGAYTHWHATTVDGERHEGTFPRAFGNEQTPWEPVYRAPATPSLEVLPAGDLPGVRLCHDDDLRWDARSGIINTNRAHAARLLQHLVVDPREEDMVQYYTYKGVIEVVPRSG